MGIIHRESASETLRWLQINSERRMRRRPTNTNRRTMRDHLPRPGTEEPVKHGLRLQGERHTQRQPVAALETITIRQKRRLFDDHSLLQRRAEILRHASSWPLQTTHLLGPRRSRVESQRTDYKLDQTS